jgi:cytochrome P450
MKPRERRRFRRDPCAYLEDLRRRSATGVIRLPGGGWCLTDPDLARTLLRDPEFNAGPSSFFGELLPTRALQVDVGHAVRSTLRARLPEYRNALATAVNELPATSRWPDAGATLMFRCVADLLLHPQAAPETRRLMSRAVHGGILFHRPHVWQRARAEILRAKLIAALTAQAGRRRQDHRTTSRDVVHRDVLDAIVSACPPEVSNRAVAELYLMTFRSIVAPVSTSLAWSVLLGYLHHAASNPPWPPEWVVREALRHRPMVWMVGRTVPRQTEFDGTRVNAGDVVSVSPYLLHHDERHWSDPQAFRPERWAEPGDRGPYIPFGAGPFTCAGIAVAHTLITEALAALTTGAHLTITDGDTRPTMADGIVPRPFTVHRTITHERQQRKEVSNPCFDASSARN